MSWHASRFAVLALALASGVTAQDELRSRLERLERRLAEVRAQEAELADLLNRHEAGEQVGDSRWLAVTEVDRARAEAAGEQGAASALARTAELRSELAKLDATVAGARLRARERASGDSLPRPEELARLADRARAEREEREPEASAAPSADEPVRIVGSTDHLRVGSALLEAGIALRHEAEELERQGRTAVAERKHAAARERLEVAHVELRYAASKGLDTPLIALFSLARVEEQLGRIDVADALYATIMERDRRVQTDGTMQYGPFGRAARTARTVMEWIRDTSDWRPRRDVDRITWDDR